MVLQKIQKVYMWYLQRLFSFIFMVLCVLEASAQMPHKMFSDDTIIAAQPHVENKYIVPEFKTATQIALSYYPELYNVNIVFKYQKSNSPLSASVAFLSLFRQRDKRKYVIIISNQTRATLKPIQLNQLTLNAQVGVIGHELAHIATFNSKSFFYFVKLFFRHVSTKSIDNHEYQTDYTTIKHGLGYQLLSWSEQVRKNLHSNQWGGSNNPKRERYMNPKTIQKILDTTAMYQ